MPPAKKKQAYEFNSTLELDQDSGHNKAQWRHMLDEFDNFKKLEKCTIYETIGIKVINFSEFWLIILDTVLM